jgi:hypothetical protein
MFTVPMGRLISNLGFNTDRTAQRPYAEWSANATQRCALEDQQGVMYVIVCFNCPIGNSSNEHAVLTGGELDSDNDPGMPSFERSPWSLARTRRGIRRQVATKLGI